MAIFCVLLDPVEPSNVCFFLMGNEVEKFDDYTVIVDGIEIKTKDRIFDVLECGEPDSEHQWQ